MPPSAKASDLLSWYDAHAREMPWRVAPQDRKNGQIPDPYRIWLSEIMLQQTTVAVVKKYFLRFTQLWPTIGDLAGAQDAAIMAEWAGLGYYARARNLLKCARIISAKYAGTFPSDHNALRALPGIGPYTAAAIGAIAFDRREAVVDGNVERVMARLFDIHTPLPTAKPELNEKANNLTPRERPGDYAQAVMDLGATICTPKKPACGLCPWRGSCRAFLAGTMAQLPKKLPKKPKPTRFGIAYVARREDGAYLLERRPERGLLGGMLGWPGSDWNDDPVPAPPFTTNWQKLPGEVRHTFTHFHLNLSVRKADVLMHTTPMRGEFLGRAQFCPTDLPTVMRKVFDMTIK